MHFQSEPFHFEPFFFGPFHSEPFHSEPFHFESFYFEPFYFEPFYFEPFTPSPCNSSLSFKILYIRAVQLQRTGIVVKQQLARELAIGSGHRQTQSTERR